MAEEGMMGGAPPGAPPPQQGQPPGQSQGQASGPGGASMPVQNQGLISQAMSQLAISVQKMQTILAVLPAGSDIAGDLRSAIDKVAKHVPPGSANPGVQMTEAQRALMQQRQQMPQQMAQKAGQMQPPPPGGGQAPPMAA